MISSHFSPSNPDKAPCKCTRAMVFKIVGYVASRGLSANTRDDCGRDIRNHNRKQHLLRIIVSQAQIRKQLSFFVGCLQEYLRNDDKLPN